MSKQSDAVKKWRYETKLRLVTAFGGQCCICGYKKCMDSIAFHHLDPSIKEFSYGNITANPVGWDKIVKEMKKCICVCHNCHHEIHAGVTEIPENYPKFDESYSDYKERQKSEDMNPCPICGTLKFKHLITCSLKCAAKKTKSIDWSKYNIEEMLKNNSITKVADIIGVSACAIRKFVKRITKKVYIHETQEEKEHRLNSRMKFKISKDELQKLVKEKSMTEIGKMFNVSSNAIKKRCNKLGIILEKYYWQHNIL